MQVFFREKGKGKRERRCCRPFRCRPGGYQGKQIIADFIKQNYPPEAIRADFSIYCKKSAFLL